MLQPNTIKSAKGATKKRKRVGRGNASGHGTYSGKGLKGQKSRSGVSGLKRLGMKSTLLQIPKSKGFKSHKPQNQVVNLIDINNNFQNGGKVSPQVLVRKGLIRSATLPVKLLGEGKLKIKDLKFENIKLSESAKKQIEEINPKAN